MAYPVRSARSTLAALAGAALLASPAPAPAQSEAWSRMAGEDLEAAYAFIEETHPGAVPARGDATFLRQLRTGRAEALALARSARTFGGYRAALERFAAAFEDPHLATASWVQPDRFWPGFLISSRRGGWKVVGGAPDAPQAGAELISCDGKAPDALAAAALAPFVSAWAVSAQRMRSSSSLLLDSGNPHQPRLQACDFRSADGKIVTYRLDWRRIGSRDLERQFAKLGPVASEDLGLRPFEGGWWIRLGTLSASAALPLMKQVEARQAELRAAPFVVVDVRGNGGGASFISDRIAEVIYGTGRVDSALYPGNAVEPQKVIWRASPTTLKTADAYVERARRIGPDHPLALGMAAQRDSIKAALTAGRALAEAPAAIDPNAALRKRDRVKRPPRVILVTDRICFSSCLQAARLFRDLGATHAGQETNANTHYSNVITTELPSGLSNFTSLQAYSTYVPRQLGPYTPAIAFEVDLADDKAVEEEVRKLIAAKSRR
jgi:hypothetical protein